MKGNQTMKISVFDSSDYSVADLARAKIVAKIEKDKFLHSFVNSFEIRRDPGFCVDVDQNNDIVVETFPLQLLINVVGRISGQIQRHPK
jgi:hypothetical protein